jgi:hypothetical protein
MRRIIVNLDDELDLWLGQQRNQNEVVRAALRLYKGDITTDVMNGIRASYNTLAKFMKSMDSKLDYIITISQQGGIDPEPVIIPTTNVYRNDIAPSPVRGFPCCEDTRKRCKHWEYDGIAEAWINSVTKKRRAG